MEKSSLWEKGEKEKSRLVCPSVHRSCRTVPISITNGTFAPLVVHFEPHEILQAHYVAWWCFEDDCYTHSFYDPIRFIIKNRGNLGRDGNVYVREKERGRKVVLSLRQSVCPVGQCPFPLPMEPLPPQWFALSHRKFYRFIMSPGGTLMMAVI